jgi:hypothetical protein
MIKLLKTIAKMNNMCIQNIAYLCKNKHINMKMSIRIKNNNKINKINKIE